MPHGDVVLLVLRLHGHERRPHHRFHLGHAAVSEWRVQLGEGDQVVLQQHQQHQYQHQHQYER